MTPASTLRRSAAVLATVLGTLVFAALPTGAAPVCYQVPQAACGFRIFPEPALSATFIQQDSGEYEGGIKALAAQFPRYVRVSTLAQQLDDPAAKSFGGRPIWLVEVTDFQVPEEGKIPVVVSLSVHGPERAGLEGGIRYAEDLARWATSEPAHMLRNGTDADSSTFPVGEVLRRVHLYLANVNPDGWARGDLANGGVFNRGNGRNVDLNREFPTLGWVQTGYTPLSEPESKAWDKFVRRIDPAVAADLHGELTSVNNSFADIMYPAGQWDPLEQAREERLARHMVSNVARYFDDNSVVLQDIAGAAIGMKPADYATAYDVVGYDDSGFMGDYFTQGGALELDVEHFLSHLVPNSAWAFPLEQAHVAAVRAEIETLMVEALVAEQVSVSLNLGNAGYLDDPAVVTSADGYGGPPPPAGVTPEPYSVTPMRYFEDLSRFAGQPLTPVASSEISGGLSGLDTFVVTADVSDDDAIAALKTFAEGGGNLVLTDGALSLLGDLGLVPASAVHRVTYNAGHINIDDFADPYTKGVYGTASQTYYEVPVGYSIQGNHAPHWVVDRAAWEAAGGVSVAHVTDDNDIGLGRVALGQGTVGILGALLPPPTEEFDHFFGLADYAVTVAGGQILNSMIAA